MKPRLLVISNTLVNRVLKILEDPQRAYVYTGCVDTCIDCGAVDGARHHSTCSYKAVIKDLKLLLRKE